MRVDYVYVTPSTKVLAEEELNSVSVVFYRSPDESRRIEERSRLVKFGQALRANDGCTHKSREDVFLSQSQDDNSSKMIDSLRKSVANVNSK